MRGARRLILRYHACRAKRGLCFYCQRPIGRDVTADEPTARRDRGPDRHENIVAACRYCNLQCHARFGPHAPDAPPMAFTCC